ncbi:MAG: DNA recombination protein RmuC [Candidatus Azobacteroides sp.]|nr:DNA recombination protein RmuC [Candidatus Azobacteroides sp.]
MIFILQAILILLVLANLWLTIAGNTNATLEELKTKFIRWDVGLSKMDSLIRDEFRRNREENQRSFKQNREELNHSFKLLGDTLTQTVVELSNAQKRQFEWFSNRQEQIRRDSETNLKEIRETVERKLLTLQEDNNKKLEEIRKVVDEKLQETVEKRFNESFKLINDRLEQVHKGLGEMQSLASGVGDLKKVLTNVKTRGNLGEIQLGAILEQVLSPEQYEQNAAVKENSLERVEYVVKLPGRTNDEKSLLLPIDSKFPNEDYQRLLDAYENMANLSARDREMIAKQFESSVKKSAKDIRDKYINPPVTTDFAILFVPTEGLYAEILRRIGLFEILQREYKITVVGPTNLVAFLSSLQMGFKTLTIEKRSSEVWELLGAVKTQFSTFGDMLEKTKKKLQQAASVIDQAGVRSRVIERKLQTVQELPQKQTIELLGDAMEIEEDLLNKNT